MSLADYAEDLAGSARRPGTHCAGRTRPVSGCSAARHHRCRLLSLRRRLLGRANWRPELRKAARPRRRRQRLQRRRPPRRGAQAEEPPAPVSAGPADMIIARCWRSRHAAAAAVNRDDIGASARRRGRGPRRLRPSHRPASPAAPATTRWAALVFCAPASVAWSVITGRVVVRGNRLAQPFDLPVLVEAAQSSSAAAGAWRLRRRREKASPCGGE